MKESGDALKDAQWMGGKENSRDANQWGMYSWMEEGKVKRPPQRVANWTEK